MWTKEELIAYMKQQDNGKEKYISVINEYWEDLSQAGLPPHQAALMIRIFS